jgi:hypothetical protein
MKKQILILVLAIIAIGFSSSVYAQPLVPRALECIDLTDPLNVVAGQPYTYDVNVPTPVGTKTYHWFVTQDVNMISAGGVIATIQTVGGPILAAGSASYNDASNLLDEVTLTFQSFTLNPTEYVFLGILVENTDGTGCVTNNFKVYRIRPVHAFSLDIANVQADGTVLGADYGANIDNCLAEIVSAQYDAVEDAIDYQFGVNTFYYAVAAANFSGSWQLRVELTGLTLSQSATITWGYTFATADANPIAAAVTADGEFTSTVPVAAQGGSVGAAGEIIYIRMVIDHGNLFEGIVLSQYALAVNGNLLTSGGTLVADGADVHHTGTPCAQVDFDDIALQSLKPRPDIQSVNPAPQGYLDIGN